MDPIAITSSLVSGPGAGFGLDEAVKQGSGSGSGSEAAAPAQSFGSMLTDKISGLNQALEDSSKAAQAVATGQSMDISTVTTQIEKASLEFQLASQIRNKALEAYQEIFRMQI